MAQRLAMEGSDVLLGARKSPNVLFGDNVKGETTCNKNFLSQAISIVT